MIPEYDQECDCPFCKAERDGRKISQNEKEEE